MKKNIIFFLPNFGAGGAGQSILNICKNINKKKYNIFILSIGKNFYKKNFKVFAKKIIEINSSSTLLAMFKIFRLLLNFDKKNTLFVSNINYANSLAVLLLKCVGKYKLILIERTPLQELFIYFSLKDFLKKKIIKILIKLLYKYADCIIANSKKIARDFTKYARIKCFFVYPLTIKKNLTIKRKKFFLQNVFEILTISRLSREKKLQDQILAIGLINKKNIKLNIIGEGPLKKKLELFALKWGINCVFYNYSDYNKIKYMKKSHLYICSSYFEGFPNAVVEAINFGLPVISSDNHGGINEILLNGKGGYKYKVGDVNSLSKIIKKIILNYDKSTKKNSFAKKKLIDFQWLIKLNMNFFLIRF